MLTNSVFMLIVAIAILILPILTYPRTEDDLELMKKGISEYFKTEQPPDYLLDILKHYQMPHVLRGGQNLSFGLNIPCGVCKIVYDVVSYSVEFGLSQQSAENKIVTLCTWLRIENERVCRGTIHEYIPIFWYIMKNKEDLPADQFCGVLLQGFDCHTDTNYEWSVNLPAGNSIERTDTPIETDPLSILHLSDIHYDPLYQPNGNGECGEPICCQIDQPIPSSKQSQCGYWSDYRTADAPWNLIEETIRQANTHHCDYAYYTGDIISHRVWDTSIVNNTESLTKIYNYLFDQVGCPVYPVLGNHEPHPLNVFAPESVKDVSLSTKWLFQLINDLWTPHLGNETSSTILKGGYYTVSPRKGFRIIALNSNVCYTTNFWLVYDDVDPYEQLQWLIQVLEQAEKDNESVHILSHVPSGDADCLHVWSREYHRIIERFADTIKAQFQGHTHRDEFHIYYNSTDMYDPINVAFNGASITPYDDANPSYKIHTVDHNAYTVLDSIEWTFNLTLANLNGMKTPEWYQLYSFREAYGIENLQPKEVAKIPGKMVENPSLIEAYFRYYYRNGDPGIDRGCDDNCKKQHLCSITTAQSNDKTQCNYYTSLYDDKYTGW